jgi:hypothetical protein
MKYAAEMGFGATIHIPSFINTNTEYTQTDINALSGIRHHDPSVRGGQDISYLVLLGHCDRLVRRAAGYYS